MTKLVKNYRSHLFILSLYSRLFYGDELESFCTDVGYSLQDIKELPQNSKPIIFHSMKVCEFPAFPPFILPLLYRIALRLPSLLQQLHFLHTFPPSPSSTLPLSAAASVFDMTVQLHKLHLLHHLRLLHHIRLPFMFHTMIHVAMNWTF